MVREMAACERSSQDLAWEGRSGHESLCFLGYRPKDGYHHQSSDVIRQLSFKLEVDVVNHNGTEMPNGQCNSNTKVPACGHSYTA